MSVATDVRSRPILFSGPMVKAILDGRKVQTRRVVKAPIATALSDGKPCGRMLYDLSRAWADRGFPTDGNGDVLPMERWGSGGPDPAPEPAYRCHYLHVPVAHPSDGWEDGRWARVRCPYGNPGDALYVRECWWEPPTITPKMAREGADTWPELVYDADATDREWLLEHGWRKRPSIHLRRRDSRLTLEITAVRVERLNQIGEDDAIAEGLRPWTHRTEGTITARRQFIELWGSINGRRPGCSWESNPWVWCLTFRRIDS